MDTLNPIWMRGTQNVDLVLFESQGTTNIENWDAVQIGNVIKGTQAALNWLTTLANKNGTPVVFSLDTRFANNPVPVSVEPIAMKFADRGQWIEQFLKQQGITLDHYNGTKDWNARRRAETGAFGNSVIYMVNSLKDVDDKFTDYFWGWSYFGGPYTVMTSGVGSWSDADLAKLLCHELMHRFGALDEYNDGTAYSSYYNISPTGIQNTNAARDRPATAPPQQDSMMADGSRLKRAFAAVESSTASLRMIFGSANIEDNSSSSSSDSSRSSRSSVSSNSSSSSSSG